MRLYPFVGPISNIITLKLFLDLGIWSSETNVYLLSVLLDVSVKNAQKPCGILGCAREKNWQHWIDHQFGSAWISKGSVPKKSPWGCTVRLRTIQGGRREGSVSQLTHFLSEQIFSVPIPICFSDALGQDEDVNTYINGSTWSIGDCIDCYCHNGVISCSRTLSVITSNDESTDNCSQPDCDVAAFLKANRGICKGK